MVDASRYAFCEPHTASGSGKWHLRRLTAIGHKPGGGIDTPSLCGRVRVHHGWDLLVVITEHHLAKNTCPECLAVYRSET